MKHRLVLALTVAVVALACAPKPPPTAAPSTGDECALKLQHGLRLRAAPERFTAENLWEHLDGGAAQIIDLGFQRLCVFQLSDEHGRGPVELEIFRMADGAAAQRLLTLWKAPASEKLTAPREAWRAGTMISFAHGAFYVRLYAAPDQPDAANLLQQAFELAAANVD